MKKLEIQFFIKSYINMKKSLKYDQDNFLEAVGKFYEQESIGFSFSKENNTIDGQFLEISKDNKIVAYTLISYDLKVQYIKYII